MSLVFLDTVLYIQHTSREKNKMSKTRILVTAAAGKTGHVRKENGTSTTLPVLEQQETLDAAWLSDLCVQAGADDVG